MAFSKEIRRNRLSKRIDKMEKGGNVEGLLAIAKKWSVRIRKSSEPGVHFEDPDWMIRGWAVIALGKIANPNHPKCNPKALETLTFFLGDPEETIRNRARQGLISALGETTDDWDNDSLRLTVQRIMEEPL